MNLARVCETSINILLAALNRKQNYVYSKKNSAFPHFSISHFGDHVDTAHESA